MNRGALRSDLDGARTDRCQDVVGVDPLAEHGKRTARKPLRDRVDQNGDWSIERAPQVLICKIQHTLVNQEAFPEHGSNYNERMKSW